MLCFSNVGKFYGLAQYSVYLKIWGGSSLLLRERKRGRL